MPGVTLTISKKTSIAYEEIPLSRYQAVLERDELSAWHDYGNSVERTPFGVWESAIAL